MLTETEQVFILKLKCSVIHTRLLAVCMYTHGHHKFVVQRSAVVMVTTLPSGPHMITFNRPDFPCKLLAAKFKPSTRHLLTLPLHLLPFSCPFHPSLFLQRSSQCCFLPSSLLFHPQCLTHSLPTFHLTLSLTLLPLPFPPLPPQLKGFILQGNTPIYLRGQRSAGPLLMTVQEYRFHLAATNVNLSITHLFTSADDVSRLQ